MSTIFMLLSVGFLALALWGDFSTVPDSSIHTAMLWAAVMALFAIYSKERRP